jgi:5,10-methylenetetrahydrofolate reductase
MTESRLKKVLTGGHFAVTAECGPPKGADPEVIKKKGNLLKGYVDSVNVTDNQTGVVRLSSLAACVILKEAGLDPVLQMVTRDRNRIALQSDVLGPRPSASGTFSVSAETISPSATRRGRRASSISTPCNFSRPSAR